MTQTQVKRSRLIGQLTENNNEFPVLGNTCWWSLRSVEINMDAFAEVLREVGLDDSYAKEHNYMSAFKRALKGMEAKRIIRIVKDDPFKVSCQFTSELQVDDGLEYDRETIIEIDKQAYRKDKEKNFAAAIVRGDEKIKQRLVSLFHEEKVTYNSHDINRYIQKILKDKGDILPLRDQGNIYFVPFAYQDLLMKVQRLVQRISKNPRSFEAMPMPDVQAGRDIVGNAASGQLETDLAKLISEIEASKDNEVTDKWKETRLARLQRLISRLETYEEVLGEGGKTMKSSAERATKELLGARKLDLE
jgi:hypothetical protein